QYERLNFLETVRLLTEQTGLVIPQVATNTSKRWEQHAVQCTALYEMTKKVAVYYQEQLKCFQPALHYLRARAVATTSLNAFGIGYAPADWQHLITVFGKTEVARDALLAV